MQPIRLLAIIEASTISGPAKNLLQFAEVACSGAFARPVEVSIAVFQRPGASQLFLQTARRASISVFPIPERARFDRSVIPALRSLAAELRPDLIQTHAVKSHFLLRQSGLQRDVPWVAFHHGYTWPDLRARLYNQLDRWSLRAAAQVVTVSTPFRRELAAHGVPADRIEVVHNAIGGAWGAPPVDSAAAELRARLGIPPASNVILIVGRLSREKDHLTLLRAVAALNADPRGLRPHLLIVGEGPERPAIQAAAAQLNLGAAVTLTGHAPSAEPYYALAAVAVLSSLSEGSPNALLEAMAARVPVAATAVGGIPEIVTHQESALLVEPRDAGGMTAALAALLTDEPLRQRLASHAHALILQRHTPEARVRRLVAIYERILAANTPDTPETLGTPGTPGATLAAPD